MVQMNLTIDELQSMIAALQTLATVKDDLVDSQAAMNNTISTHTLHIDLLRKEVEVAGDFLLD